MDWPSFILGFISASVLASVIAGIGYIVEQRRQARAVFTKYEPPSGRRTRKLRAREIDPLVDDTKDHDT